MTQEPEPTRERYPNRSRKIVPLVVAIGALLAVSVAMATLLARDDHATDESATMPSADRPSQTPARQVAQAPAAPARPPASVVAECNELAAQAERDNMRILRDGAIGGAVGAGLGAAGGAIADGGEGAGKGAGIGALVGVTAGALYGLNEENRRSEQAAAAYQRCMAGRGY